MNTRLRLAPISPSPPAGPSAARGPAGSHVVLFLPAHNEEAAVAGVLARVPRTIAGHPVVPLVIDDGSTDRTVARAQAAGAEAVALGAHRGLGAAVRRGLAEGCRRNAVAIAFCDADNEYAPEELEQIVAPILADRADYVVGSRFRGHIERMRWSRRLGNYFLTRTLAWAARAPITDGQSGYRALSPSAAAAAEIAHDFNYAQVLTLDLMAKRFRYAEIPISYRFRETGRSFVRLLPYLRHVVPAAWRELNSPRERGRAERPALTAEAAR